MTTGLCCLVPAISALIASAAFPSVLTENVPQTQGGIIVTVVGVKGEQGGNLVLVLYRGKDGWLKTDKALARRTVPVREDSMTVTFEGVPYDTSYALQVFHDKNRNGKMDMRKFPFPKPAEGAGVSNNNVRMGPPKFDKARFKLEESSTAIRIQMRY